MYFQFRKQKKVFFVELYQVNMEYAALAHICVSPKIFHSNRVETNFISYNDN